MNKNFFYATYITWDHAMDSDEEFQNLTRDRLNELISQGKTNNIKSSPTLYIHDGDMTYRRVWSDKDHAQQWIDFVKGIININDKEFQFSPLPEKLMAIFNAKGLVNYVKSK